MTITMMSISTHTQAVLNPDADFSRAEINMSIQVENSELTTTKLKLTVEQL